MATASRSTDAAMHEHEPHVTHPMEHVPRLVLSAQVSGDRILDRVADFVNRLIGSMYLFVAITFGIVIWLFAGNIVGFDKTPWPLLLTLLNLPQLSIMISLQVSANRALAAADARAIADHETLHAIHELAKMQIEILDGQNKVLEGQNLILELLRKAHPMPTGQGS
jgi:uncharacterized membrane protein